MSSDLNKSPLRPDAPPTAPLDSSGLPSAQFTRRVKTTMPRVIGILNIVFGSLILLSVLLQEPMLVNQQSSLRERAVLVRQRRIDALKTEETESSSAEDKKAIVEQREALEAEEIVLPDISSLIYPYVLIEQVTGVVLNAVLIVAGIWLIRLKNIGRRLSLWVSGIKVVRLLVLQSYFLFFIVPVFSKEMGALSPGNPIEFMPNTSASFGLILSGVAVCTFVFGSIYPAIVLKLLSTSRAKQACRF